MQELDPQLSEAMQAFRCLKCHYLLTGLSGDPIVCPECGEHNAVAELEFHHSLDPQTCAVLQSAPALAAAGIFLVLLGLGLVMESWQAWLLVLVGVTLWGVGARRFRRATDGDRAARTSFRALVWLTVALLVAVAGGLCALSWAIRFFVGRAAWGYGPRVAGVALAVGALWGVASLAAPPIFRHWSVLSDRVMAAQRRRIEEQGPQRGTTGREDGSCAE